MIKLFTRKPSTDALESQLRTQAQAFDPAPPANMHRRIISTLAQADAAPRPARHARAPWLWAAGTLTAGLIVALVLLRDHPVSNPPKPSRELPGLAIKTPNPLALATEYVDTPLQCEVQNLLNDLSRASDTITRAIPGASKPQTKPGA